MKQLSEIRKILIIMLGGIGDMVHFSPTLFNVHKCFPEAMISFLVYQSKAEDLVKNAPFVNKIFRVGIDVNAFTVIPRLRKESFDMTIISSGTNPLKSAILSYLIGSKYRVGEERFWCNLFVKNRKNGHYLEKNLHLLEAIGCQAEDKDTKIWLKASDWEYKENLIKQYNLRNKPLIIGLHPGSTERLAFKRWPIERYAALLEKIKQKYHVTFIIFGSTAEENLSNTLVSHLNFKPINLAGKTTVSQAAAAISICNLFISNDTGLMHLATVFDVPVIAIYGPTSHDLHGPFGDDNIIIRHNLPCSPCYEKKPIKCPHLQCINGISVEEVMSAVEIQIKRFKSKAK